jgi:hypothetical protein
VSLAEVDINANEALVWNAFVDLLATIEHKELSARQRLAQLVFWYEAEIQNGGHLQFFWNCGPDRGSETSESLRALGAHEHALVLKQALERWNAVARLAPADTMEYAAIAAEREFDDLDRAFHDCRPPLIDVLRRHLAENETEYIVRE